MTFGTLSTLLQDEVGATAIEYGLIASLISIAAVVGYESVGSLLHDIFDNLEDKLEAVNTLSE